MCGLRGFVHSTRRDHHESTGLPGDGEFERHVFAFRPKVYAFAAGADWLAPLTRYGETTKSLRGLFT